MNTIKFLRRPGGLLRTPLEIREAGEAFCAIFSHPTNGELRVNKGSSKTVREAASRILQLCLVRCGIVKADQMVQDTQAELLRKATAFLAEAKLGSVDEMVDKASGYLEILENAIERLICILYLLDREIVEADHFDLAAEDAGLLELFDDEWSSLMSNV